MKRELKNMTNEDAEVIFKELFKYERKEILSIDLRFGTQLERLTMFISCESIDKVIEEKSTCEIEVVEMNNMIDLFISGEGFYVFSSSIVKMHNFLNENFKVKEC